jgi:hypothetical protein
MAAAIDAEIDRLYQLAPGEFTAARKALAKTAGQHAADVRHLAKPSLPAWAVNQLYWKRRPDYDALVKASTELRKAHRAILGGHRGDIREAAKEHDAAVDQALKSTLALLRDEGHPLTDATRQAIQTTLRALPVDEAPGRLTHALQPGGFEMLTGLSIAPVRHGTFGARAEPARARASAARAKRDAAAGRAAVKEDATARQKAKEAAAKAARELRLAEHEAQREEFEAARAAREADKAARAVERAREALEAAQKELEEAERGAREAERTREAARCRAESAAAAVTRLKDA